MSFDPAWEDGYKNNAVGIGRNNAVYSLMDSYCQGHQQDVLELGCGAGFNVQYWLDRNADYRAIDGSAKVVEHVHRLWPVLRERVVCGDFTNRPLPFDRQFDVIFDRASVSHNDLPSIKRAVANVYDFLKPGGLFLSCDWFSTTHTEMFRGHPTEDPNTRTGYDSGVFRNCGRVHFSDRDEITSLFSDFQTVLLQEHLIIREYKGCENRWSCWDFVMRKAA